MKKHFLIVLMLFFLLLLPAQAADRKAFLAVFCNPGATLDWEDEHPDLIITGSTWLDFDSFIKLTKQLSKGRDVILDIGVHGEPTDGNLWLEYEAFGYELSYSASMGHVLNEITENLPHTKACYLEICYASICMQKSLRKPILTIFEKKYKESYKFPTIPYPVYGAGNCSNYNNLVWLEDKYSIKPYFMDLRDVIGKPAILPDDTHDSITKAVWALISTYGTK